MVGRASMSNFRMLLCLNVLMGEGTDRGGGCEGLEGKEGIQWCCSSSQNTNTISGMKLYWTFLYSWVYSGRVYLRFS